MILKLLFDISTDFRFSKISVGVFCQIPVAVLALVHLITSGLFWIEIEFVVHVALSKWAINLFKLV